MATKGERLERSLISSIIRAGYHFKPDYVVVPPKPVWDPFERRYKEKCVLEGLIFDPQITQRERILEVTASCSWDTPHKQAQRAVLEAAGLFDRVLLLGHNDNEMLLALDNPILMRRYLRPKIGW